MRWRRQRRSSVRAGDERDRLPRLRCNMSVSAARLLHMRRRFARRATVHPGAALSRRNVRAWQHLLPAVHPDVERWLYDRRGLRRERAMRRLEETVTSMKGEVPFISEAIRERAASLRHRTLGVTPHTDRRFHAKHGKKLAL